MNPTPTQSLQLETLAALAATMASPTESPASTARRARELWEACAEELSFIEPHWQARREAVDRGNALFSGDREFLANFTPGENVPLDAFLTAIMPRSKPGDRLVAWRAYAAASMRTDDIRAGLPERSAAEVADAVAKLVRRDREEGFPFSAAPACRLNFLRFLKQHRAEKKAEAGKSGGRPKKSLGDPKKTPKRPQVRKAKP